MTDDDIRHEVELDAAEGGLRIDIPESVAEESGFGTGAVVEIERCATTEREGLFEIR